MSLLSASAMAILSELLLRSLLGVPFAYDLELGIHLGNTLKAWLVVGGGNNFVARKSAG